MRRTFYEACSPGSPAQVLLLIVAVACVSIQGQTGAVASPAFEVASIRPATAPEMGGAMLCLVPCRMGSRLTVDGSQVSFRYYALTDLILKAYRLKPYQLSIANPDTIRKSDWDSMESLRFDIAATIPEGVSTTRVPEMLQVLLAERFKLSLHKATRELPVYALMVGKNGPKLKEPQPDADAPVEDTPGSSRIDTPQGEARSDKEGYAIASGPYGPIRAYADKAHIIHTDFLRITMEQLVEMLGQDRPVIDKTNLKGYYQFSILRLSQMAASEAGERPPLRGEPERDALEKAGLRLMPTTAPLDVVVIDHLEKSPTTN